MSWSYSFVVTDTLQFLLAQIGVHYDGIFYEFAPWKGVVTWEISPWGHWFITADNGMHLVTINLFKFLLSSRQ